MKDEISTITKIEEQKKNSERVNVFIDNEFAFGCSVEIILKRNIKKGDKVDKELLCKIAEEDNYINCKNTAFRFVEKSCKTEHQVIEKLRNKGYDEKIISRAMAMLKEYNFVDDKKFAYSFIKEKISCMGRKRIKYSLSIKGIPKEIICETLDNLDSELEKAAAFKIAENKYNNLLKGNIPWNKVYKKLGDYLLSAGYELPLVQEVLKKVVVKPSSDYMEENTDVKTNNDKIYELALKRYNIIIKTERDEFKIYKKLCDYLMRRGFSYEEVKKVLDNIVKNADELDF